MFTVRLTPLQRRILIRVLVEWATMEDTREWVDTMTNAKVTLDELISLFGDAKEEVGDEPVSVLKKALELCNQFSNDWIAEGPSGPDSVWAKKTPADWIKQAKEASDEHTKRSGVGSGVEKV